MALVKCPECGKQISDKAERCIHCGFKSDLTVCPECGATMSRSSHCEKCGYEFGHEERVEETYNNTPVEGNPKQNGFATAGLVLGLCSILAWLLPLVGYPCTILGIIFSSIGLKSEKKDAATAGLILSIILLLATLFNSAAGVLIALS